MVTECTIWNPSCIVMVFPIRSAWGFSVAFWVCTAAAGAGPYTAAAEAIVAIAGAVAVISCCCAGARDTGANVHRLEYLPFICLKLLPSEVAWIYCLVLTAAALVVFRVSGISILSS